MIKGLWVRTTKSSQKILKRKPKNNAGPISQCQLAHPPEGIWCAFVLNPPSQVTLLFATHSFHSCSEVAQCQQPMFWKEKQKNKESLLEKKQREKHQTRLQFISLHCRWKIVFLTAAKRFENRLPNDQTSCLKHISKLTVKY